MRRIYTAEAVTEGHPDKVCDMIADSVLDACLKGDPQARVACEVMATKGHILIAGEITSSCEPNVIALAKEVMTDIGYETKDFQFDTLLHQQSLDIAGGVNKSLEARQHRAVEKEWELGAGDQGIMVGYACKETRQFMPMSWVLANRIVRELRAARRSGYITGFLPDGKAQVSVEYGGGKPIRLDTVIVSCQHIEEKEQEKLEKEIRSKVLHPALRILPADDKTRILINPSGRFVEGGPAADTGMTGRKLMADTYGSMVPHGGGAFSGKDATKVDRTGAYMARYIAKNMVAAGLAERCQVTLAYVIGMAEPVAVDVETFGTGTACADDCLAAAVPFVFGLTPYQMIESLKLNRPIFKQTAAYGHFGRNTFPWEQTDRAARLKEVLL